MCKTFFYRKEICSSCLKMLDNSRKTRLFALLTFASTFVYYGYNVPTERLYKVPLMLDGQSFNATDSTIKSDIRAKRPLVSGPQLRIHEPFNQLNQENILKTSQTYAGDIQIKKNENHGQSKLSQGTKQNVFSSESLWLTLPSKPQVETETPGNNEDLEDNNAIIPELLSSELSVSDDRKEDLPVNNGYPKNNAIKTEQLPSELNLNTSRKEEQDIIVFNNKVYHRNDTLPQRIMKYPILTPSSGNFYRKYDFSIHKPMERKFLKERAKVMVERAKTVAKVCAARSKMAVSLQLNLVWDLKHKVLWCPLYKVASTSWMTNFLRLAHFNEDHPDLKHLRPKIKDKKRFQAKYGAKHSKVFELYRPPQDRDVWRQTLKSSLRMIIVRHPFTRILSAYRDKMLKFDPHPRQFKFRDLQLKIITMYRPVDSQETSPFPTFPEFIQYMIDSSQKLLTAKDWIDNVHCWTPYWALCNVCGADYNVIIKLETMKDDEKFLITLTNMEEIKQLKFEEWKHLRNVSSSDVAPRYYNQLSHPQIKQLYQIYQLDFKLFGYKINDVIKWHD